MRTLSRKATLSVLGLYQWDNDLFENMVIPSALSIDTLVDNLLSELAELEVLYPDPVLMKSLIGAWSNKMIFVWNELYETTQYDYNPIENYNRMESGSSEGNKSTSNSGTDTSGENIINGGTDTNSETVTNGGTDTSSESVINGGTDTNTHTATVNSAKREAGYDSTPSGNDDGLVDTEKNSNSGTSTDSVAYGQTVSRTGSLVHGQTVNKTGSLVHGQTVNRTGSLVHGHKIDSDEESEYTNHAHGNIGVTTTQKLIREQREISEFNVYSKIIDDFKNRFCIIVW